jgi:hypothetical protein
VLRATLTIGLLLTVAPPSCRGDAAPGATRHSEPAARAGASLETPHYRIRASVPRDCPARGLPTRARRIGVEISLEPTGSVQVPANPYYAQLVDGQGTVYEATLGGCGPALSPSLPGRGQPASGWIVFDVPRGARDFILIYAPELVGAPKSELSIDLTGDGQAPRREGHR